MRSLQNTIELLPGRFRNLRDCQKKALLRNSTSRNRFCGHSMPTGSGKSLVYMLESLMSPGRSAILTSTKALQDQIQQEYSSLYGPHAVADLRGRSNYQCRFSPDGTCSNRAYANCPHRDSPACPYHSAYERARSSRIVVTNYACWISLNRYGKGLGHFDRLSLDEAHELFDTMISLASFRADRKLLDSILKTPPGDDPEQWRQWARKALCSEQGRRYRALLSEIASVDESWRIAASATGIEFEPTRVEKLCQSLVYRGASQVRLYSAVLVPKTMESLGATPFDFYRYDYPFDPDRSLVYQIPCVRINRNNTEEDIGKLVHAVDEIVSRRLDRKGIIHTVNYRLCQKIVSSSRFRNVMITHEDSSGLRDAVRTFSSSRPPAVLVSPSVTTGLDFPGDQCRYQIVAKTPWPDLSSDSITARTRFHPDCPAMTAAQTLAQMTGRGMRSADDWCENFLLDDSIEDFVRMHGDLLPQWWLGLYRKTSRLPDPPADGRT